MSPLLATPPGWFGKLSSLGDFAHRRLPPEFIAACDTWLSDSMASSRDRLAGNWLDTYLTAPLWRFAWAPGVVDERWWFGVLMPSCDSVGRYFPLLVAQPHSDAPYDRSGLDHLECWYDRVAEAAAQTLRPGASLDAFEQALAMLPPWPARPSNGGTGGASVDALAARERHRLADDTPLASWLHGLSAGGLLQRWRGCSLWRAQTGEPCGGRVSVARGLPDAGTFDELLSGDW